MTITELSIKRPILIVVFFLIISLLGIFAVRQLKYELLPKINAPYITIVSVYEGASPAEVENSITKKIEDAISSVSKVKRITSRSNEGYAIISIEFIQDTDIDMAMQEVQRQVNQVVPQFPNGAKSPVIDKYSLADLPILRIAASSKMNENEFYRLLKDQIKPRLAQLSGVGRIQLVGGNEKKINILIDEQRLKYYQMPILAVVHALQKANLEIPIGNIKDKDAQFGLRINGKFTQFETIANLDIALLPDGSKIKLKDIARIESGDKDTHTVTRLNQKNAVGIVIQKQSNANAVDVAEKLRKELKTIETEYITERIQFEVAADSSDFTLKATDTVFHDLIIAIVLVALVMLVFLHSIRNSLIVMLAIPTSLVFSFIGMWAMDFTLNLMTLLAMSLVIGILVDDSIVVLENIYRHLEMGKDKVRASIAGRNEIGFSALSITLVDVVVFLPLAFVPGITGGLVKEFALVIVSSTLASLLVSFTLIPMLSSRYAKLEHFSSNNWLGWFFTFIEKQLSKLTFYYGLLLKIGLRNRWVIYIIAFGSLFASVILVTNGIIGGEFLPPADKGEISVIIETPEGSKFDETNYIAKRIEKKLSKLPEVTRIFSTVGVSNDPFYGQILGDNQIELSVLLVDKTERNKSVIKLSQQICDLVLQEPGTKVKVSPIGIIGTEMVPIQILISGADREKVMQYAKSLKQNVKKIDGTDDIRLSAIEGKSELVIQINRDRLASLGLELVDVATSLRVALTGYDELKFRENNTEYHIRFQLQNIDRNSTTQITNLSFINNRGEVIYLNQIATIQRITSPSVLERRNKNASVILFSKTIGKTVNEIGNDIVQMVTQNPPPIGVNVSYEGDMEMADDSFFYLSLALIAGITFMFLIMVALYNSFLYPFVVLFSIPVALTGALLALGLTMKSLNVFSIFGVIMMLGLVAKNAILIVDKTNEMKFNDRNVLYSLLTAGKTRLRPILMTTLSMVIGMLPLALQNGASAEYNSALAWVLIGGLSSSMIFTLFVVPSIYLELDRLKVCFSKIFNSTSQINIKISNKTLLIAFGIIVLATANAQKTLSLKEAENLLVTKNPELMIKKQEIEKSTWQITDARSIYLPSLNFSSTYTYNIKPQVFFLPATFFNSTANPDDFASIEASAKNVYQANLTLEMPLVQFQNKAILSNAKLNKENKVLNYQSAEKQKISDIRKTYYSALLAKSQIDFWTENNKQQLRILEESKQRLHQGLLNETDTLQIFLQVENIKPNILNAKNDYQLAIRQLILLLNSNIDENISLTDSLSWTPSILLYENSKLENRTDIQQLYLQTKILDNNLKIENASILPNLQLVAQHSLVTQYKNFEFNKYQLINADFVGLQLTVPIFNGYRNLSKIKQAQISHKQGVETLEYTKKQANFEVQTFITNLQNISAQLVNQEKINLAAYRYYQLVYNQWKQGLVKQSDLQSAQLSIQLAKLNQFGLIYKYLITEAELKRIKGL